MISLEKLKAYDKYNGDDDRLMWAEHENEISLFKGNGDWALIKSLYHDIEMIRNGLAADSYKEQTLTVLRQHCDGESYNILSAKILNTEMLLTAQSIENTQASSQNAKSWWQRFWG